MSMGKEDAIITTPSSHESVLSEKAAPSCKKTFHGAAMPPKAFCAICLDAYRFEEDDCSIAALPCQHVFHYDCIEKWYDPNGCPKCRSTAGLPPKKSGRGRKRKKPIPLQLLKLKFDIEDPRTPDSSSNESADSIPAELPTSKKSKTASPMAECSHSSSTFEKPGSSGFPFQNAKSNINRLLSSTGGSVAQFRFNEVTTPNVLQSPDPVGRTSIPSGYKGYSGRIFSDLPSSSRQSLSTDCRPAVTSSWLSQIDGNLLKTGFGQTPQLGCSVRQQYKPDYYTCEHDSHGLSNSFHSQMLPKYSINQTWIYPKPATTYKEWHAEFGELSRAVALQEFVYSLYASPSTTTATSRPYCMPPASVITDQLMSHVFQFERTAYESTDNIESYNYLLSAENFKLQKSFCQKDARKRSLDDNQASSSHI